MPGSLLRAVPAVESCPTTCSPGSLAERRAHDLAALRDAQAEALDASLELCALLDSQIGNAAELEAYAGRALVAVGHLRNAAARVQE